MMEDKDWLKGLQNKMKDYEEPAPEGLWEDIEPSVFPEKKRHVVAMPILWRSVAAAAVVALGVFAGLRLSESLGDKPDDVSQEALASGQPSSVNNDGGRDSSVEIVSKPEAETLLADSRPVRKRQTKARPSGNKTEPDLVTDVSTHEAGTDGAQSFASEETIREKVNQNRLQNKLPEENLETVKPESPSEKKSGFVSTGHDGEDWSDYISATDSRASGRGKTVLDVSLSGGSMDVSDERSYDLQMFYRGSAPASSNGLFDDSNNHVGDEGVIQTRGMAPMDLKSGSTVTSHSHHSRPVRMALTVNFPLSGTFGLETGAMMTTLRSTFTTEAGRTVTETDQTLRYVGIPLNITASLVDTRWFSFYLGGGGMAEKCISGKSVKTETLAGVKQGDGTRKSLNVKPLLWSLNASAGLQANLTKNIGLYVEPGLSYHFDDKSDVQTIYNDRPLDFMLTFGARFSLK